MNGILFKLEIRVLQNLAKLGGGCIAGWNFGGIWICVWGFSPFRLVYFETKSVSRRSFRWLAYRLPPTIFVYHAPIGLHEVVPPAFLKSSCLTLLKLCYTVARQLYGHLQPATYIYIYIFFFRSNSRRHDKFINLATLASRGIKDNKCIYNALEKDLLFWWLTLTRIIIWVPKEAYNIWHKMSQVVGIYRICGISKYIVPFN